MEKAKNSRKVLTAAEGTPPCTVCEIGIESLRKCIMVKSKQPGDRINKTYPFAICSEKCKIIALNSKQTKCFVCGEPSKYENSMQNTVKLGQLYSIEFSFPGCSIECAKKLEEIMSEELEPYLPNDLERVNTHQCKYCGKMGKKKTTDKETLKICTGCRIVWYCDTICQKRDWPTHRLVCKK